MGGGRRISRLRINSLGIPEGLLGTYQNGVVPSSCALALLLPACLVVTALQASMGAHVEFCSLCFYGVPLCFGVFAALVAVGAPFRMLLWALSALSALNALFILKESGDCIGFAGSRCSISHAWALSALNALYILKESGDCIACVWRAQICHE